MTEFVVQTEPSTAEAPAPVKDEGLLAGKFKNTPEGIAELAKAYGESQKKIGQLGAEKGQPTEQKPPETVEQTTEEKKPEVTEENPNSPKAVREALATKGVDPDVLLASYQENGKFTDADYESLAKAGYSKAMVDNYVAGQQAIADSITRDVHSVVGGEEGWNAMAAWAKENLTDKEKTAFNAVTDKGSVDELKLAVSGLYARFQAANGVEPKLVHGNASADVQGGYESYAQMTADMRKPEYKKDPAFRDKVMQRVAKSKF